MRKILITGASGFVGSEFVRSIDRTKYQLITVDLSGNVDIRGDLSSSTFVNSLPDVDAVVHCAAVQYVTKKLPIIKRTKFFHENNVVATRNLLERYSSVNHFVHIGTSMMYRQTEFGVYSVESEYYEQGVYSASKIQCQQIVDSYSNTSTIIPCIIGGKGRGGLFEGFVKSIQKYNTAIFPGNGSMPISVVHISDLTSLIQIVLETGSKGKFNAACNDAISISGWVDVISELINGVSARPRIYKIPLFIAKIISFITCRRVLAKEQLLMLTYPHVIDISTSVAIGWSPKFNSSDVISDIASSLIES